MIALVLVAVFAGTMLLVMAVYVLVNRRRLAAGDTLRERLSSAGMDAPATTILKDHRASDIAALDRLLQGKGLTASLERQIERAGSQMSVGVFILLSLLCAMIGVL